MTTNELFTIIAQVSGLLGIYASLITSVSILKYHIVKRFMVVTESFQINIQQCRSITLVD